MSTDEYPLRYAQRGSLPGRSDSTNLAELLERILDKGIIIAGDIAIYLVDIELLTIKIRLLIASVDKAKEIGVNWWESDPWLNAQASRERDESRKLQGGDGKGPLRQRVDRLESTLDSLTSSEGTKIEDDVPAKRGSTSGRSRQARSQAASRRQRDG